MVTTNFYDDYPTLEFAMAAENTTQVVSGFFQLLGWRHAVSGKKAKPFASTFAALGMEYDLTNLHESFFTVGNKPERLQRIERMIQQAACDGRVSCALAAYCSTWAPELCIGFRIGQGFTTINTRFLISCFGLGAPTYGLCRLL